MTKFKDLKSKEVAGRFPRIGKYIKHYGEKEFKANLKNEGEADMAADIERFGEDITEKEYLSK